MHLVCGEALFDFFAGGSDGPGAIGFDARAGGSPFNVAIGMVRQGAAAGLLTGLSTDMLGARLAALLEAEGVATGYLIRSGRRTTISLVDLVSEGAPQYAFYGLGSADCSVTFDDIAPLGPEVTGLHFGSYSIAVAPVADAFATLAERNAQLLISLDPNVRPTVEPDMDVWRARIDRLLQSATVVKVSREDLDLLYPSKASGEIAADWLGKRPELVVVTDGGAAVTAFRAGGPLSITPPAIEVVDTVGAGDAFQATLLARLIARPADAPLGDLAEDALAAILVDAAEVAAETCRRRGADIPRLR